MNAAVANRDDRFLALVAENQARIYKICRVYAWNPADQDDLRQEILLQIWRSLPQLREDAHANTWLYRVALNTAISFLRRRKADQSSSCPPAALRDLAENNTVHPSEPPQVTALYEAISKLDTVERALITLFLEDLSYEEIAEVMGLNRNHVGVLLHRIKKKLGELIQEVVV